MFQFSKDVGELNLQHFRVNPLDHIGLVCSIASEFLNRGFEFDDLAFYGIVGLLQACKRFDDKRGIKFCTYGSHWIREEIQSAFYNYLLPIRVPVHVYAREKKIKRKEVDCEELGKITKECVEAARRVWSASFLGMSQESEGVEPHDEITIPDYRDDHDLWRQEEIREFLLRELTKLEAQEHRIMILLYYKGMTVKNIVEATGISKDIVRKTRDQALRKLRESIQAVGA